MTRLDQRIVPAAPATDTITGRQRAALAVLLTAGFTLAVDFSILNVALPTIGADVGFALSDLQWIATSFALCAAGFTLFFGRVADLYGRRRLFLLGIAALGLSSLVGGLADTTVGAPRRPRGAGPGHRGRDPRRAVAADHVLSGRTATGEGARPQRSADGGRLHHRRGAGRRPDRGAQLAVGVLHQRRRGRRGPRRGADGAVREPAAASCPPRRARGRVGHRRPRGRRVRADPGRRAWLVRPARLAAAAGGLGLLAIFWAVETPGRRTAGARAHPAPAHRRLGQPGRRTGVRHRDLARVPAHPVPAGGSRLLRRWRPVCRSPCSASAPCSAGCSARASSARSAPAEAIVAGFVVQAAATAPLVLLGEHRAWLAVLLAATFVGGVANLVVIVGFMVTVTVGPAGRRAGPGARGWPP